MLNPLLHRGSSFRAVCCRSSGCIVDRIPSAGNTLFANWFSSTTHCWAVTAKQEWRDIFEGIFEKPTSQGKDLFEHQPAASTSFLLSIFENTVHNKGARQDTLNATFTQKKLQLAEDDGLLQVFRHLVRELNVDHAIELCTKLPANRLKSGIDTLIKVFLEGVYETTYQHELADKIFELLEESKGKGCMPSEVTSQSLLKWLLDNGDAVKAQKLLKLLQWQQHSNVQKSFECPESTDLDEVKHAEDKMNQGRRKMSDSVVCSSVYAARSWTRSAEDLLNFMDELDESQITFDTKLTSIFQSLGRLGYQEKCLDNFMSLQLKGMPKGELSTLIDFYAQGLTEVSSRNSRNIKRDVEGFKRINRLLKLSTSTSFNKLISHCANHGKIDLCIDLIQTMKMSGLEPCAASYEPLIIFFTRTYEISKAEDILQMMRNNDMHATNRTYEYLILAHTKADNLEKAYNLIEEIPLEELTPNLYTPIIFRFGMKGKISQALSVFMQMERKNVKPNYRNFACLIHACGNRKNVKGAEKVFKLFKKQKDFSEENHKSVMLAMLKAYANCGSYEQIEKIISCADANDLVTPKVMSALLKGLADGGKTQEAIQVYKQIRNARLWPDSWAFLSLLSIVGETGELDKLLVLFGSFKKSVQSRSLVLKDELISKACSTIVHALIHRNQLEKALGFLQQVQQDNAGDVETLCLKVFTEDKRDTTSVQPVHLTLLDKLEFLHAMRDRLKVQPTRLAYESLLESCAREKDPTCAALVLRMMQNDNLKCNVFTYLLLLRIVVASGDFEGLNMFLSNMRKAVKNSGLHDAHVRMVVKKIIQSASFKTTDLMGLLYPSEVLI